LDEIRDSFAQEHPAVHAFFAAIPPEQFFAAPPEIWSPADNLAHLIKSCQPVLLGLKLPRLALRMRFGLAEAPSGSLAALRDRYVNVALAGGGQASGRYLPEVTDTSAASREHLLAEWQRHGAALLTALEGWSEDDLEKYRGEHPLLGLLTIREILFFTLYHNLHHVNDVQRLLGQPEAEWFST
ncbi:MAG: DinB family protein, partial [Anaerolineales bacterium]|nr:DinB family protein [Anaerolineales bacterium]